MAVKTTKSRSHSSKPTKKTGPPKAAKKRSTGDKAAKEDAADVLSVAAMQNVYYIAHNAATCLEFRGYGCSKDKRNKATKRKKIK
ncbi:small lysine-rich protein 1 [Festucalex cinctus]